MNHDDDPIKYLNSVNANHKFSFKIISEESMLTSLLMLKSGKAPGPDGVSTNLVKYAAKSIAKPLVIYSMPLWHRGSSQMYGNSLK